jgi:dihydroorotase-like cyclic amidohydrolase
VGGGLASLADAWSMASERPARLLGMNPGLRPGCAADLVLFDWDGSAIRPRSVDVRGREVFAADQG